ncbi:hypothetical protein PIROE2DRAFT_16520, partial [Piromyces sp. E2]
MKLNTVTEQTIINNEPSIFYSLYTLYAIIIFSSISLVSSLFYLAYRYYIRSENEKIQFNVITIFINVIKQWKEKYGTFNITILKDIQSSENSNTNTISDTVTTAESESISNSESKECSNTTTESINTNKSVKSIINSKKDLLYTKIKNGSDLIQNNYNKCKRKSSEKIKSISAIPIRQTYIYNYVRNHLYDVHYFIVSNYNQLKIRIIHRGNKYLPIKNKSDDQVKEVEDLYQNDITKIFNNTFDQLMDNTIDKEYDDIKNKNVTTTSSSSTSSTSTSPSPSSSSSIPSSTPASQVKLPKFHYDYYSKKIIFHTNSLYHEQNAKKYNTIEANVDKDKLFSSVTIVLTTGNHKELSYFPKYPWYWDGVELFTGISVHPRPFYHPNYLSVIWKPRRDVFSLESLPFIGNSVPSSGKQLNHSSLSTSSSSASATTTTHESENKREFTLS